MDKFSHLQKSLSNYRDNTLFTKYQKYFQLKAIKFIIIVILQEKQKNNFYQLSDMSVFPLHRYNYIILAFLREKNDFRRDFPRESFNYRNVE